MGWIPTLLQVLVCLGGWSVFESNDPAKAGLVSELFANRPGTELAIWKQPSKQRGYVAKATFGREPDCPNCCAAGCPIAGAGYLPGESIEAQTARLNAGFPTVPAGQLEAEVAADVARLAGK